MEEMQNESGELFVTETHRIEVPEGVYRALYKGFNSSMENTPWGEKKIVKMKFSITSGPGKGSNLTFRGMMMQDDATGKWIIGHRSKLGAAIKAINPNGMSINENNINTPVLVRVTKNVSKKTGETYTTISEVMPVPIEDDAQPMPQPQRAYANPPQAQGYEVPAQAYRNRTAASNLAPQNVQPRVTAPQQQTPRPAAQQAIRPAPQQAPQQSVNQAPQSKELLEDLTELGDYGL